MKKTTIIQNEHATLRATAERIESSAFGSKSLENTLASMSEALATREDGVALAAPQIGVSKRIFIVAGSVFPKDPDGTTLPDLVFINPEIIATSKDTEVLDEGCLSVTGVYGKVERHTETTVKAQNKHGEWFEMEGSGLLSQIFQHEIDHLDGILFIDKATSLD